jgi:hypothetical protein
MATTLGDTVTRAALTELPEQQRQRAFDRYQMLRPHLEQDMPLARVAAEASLPLKTAQHWVSRYLRFGLARFICAGPADQGSAAVSGLSRAIGLSSVLRWTGSLRETPPPCGPLHNVSPSRHLVGRPRRCASGPPRSG